MGVSDLSCTVLDETASTAPSARVSVSRIKQRGTGNIRDEKDRSKTDILFDDKRHVNNESIKMWEDKLQKERDEKGMLQEQLDYREFKLQKEQKEKSNLKEELEKQEVKLKKEIEEKAV